MKLRPVDIARRLGVTTMALRNYEESGMVPPVRRAPNGYRQYTEEHEAYFECIRAMQTGFGLDLTGKVLRCVIRGEVEEALWLVNEAQAGLYGRKQMAEKTLQVLELKELDLIEAKVPKRSLTIGEASQETGVPASAIRHWEKMGLVEAARNPENGYRTFHPAQVRRIRIIGTLRTAVWSLEVIREVIRELDHNNLEQARRIAQESLRFMNETNRHQIRGIHYLHRVLEHGCR